MRGLSALANTSLRRDTIRRGFCSSRLVPSSGSHPNPTALFTWGMGTQGQLGHERFTVTNTGWGVSKDYIQPTPRRVVPSKEIASISCGVGYTLGLTYSGEVLGWGEGFAGKESKSNVPVKIDTSACTARGRKVAQVIAGPRHCAAIDDAGQVLTWGHNGGWYEGGGQLGHGNTESLSVPKYIESFRAYGAVCAEASLGSQHTLLRTTDGEVLVCGHGEHGRLGTGDLGNVETPQTIEPLLQDTIVQVCAGSSHSLALSDKGKLFSWGKNDSGQLGIRDSMMDMNSLEPFPLLLPAETFHKEAGAADAPCWIAASSKRSLAVTTGGDLYIWGLKLSHFPVIVDRAQFGNLRVKRAYLAGEKYMCVLAVTEDGSLWSLGNPKSRLLGYDAGSTMLVNLPAQKLGEGLWDRRTVRGVHVGQAHVGVVVDMA